MPRLTLLYIALSCVRAVNLSFASVFVGESVVLQVGTSRVWGVAGPGASVEPRRRGPGWGGDR